jgi:hypothetical protein
MHNDRMMYRPIVYTVGARANARSFAVMMGCAALSTPQLWIFIIDGSGAAILSSSRAIASSYSYMSALGNEFRSR